MKKLLLTVSLLIIVLVGCENPKEEFTVTFESNGGTEITDVTVLEGDTISEPTQPEQQGYTFTGWFSDSTLNSAYDFSQVVNGSLTLYAKWNPNEYDVTFVPNDGVDGSGSVYTYAYGEEITELEPTREGYTFDGWYTDEALTNAYTFGTMEDSDITLYGKWTINQVTVSFDTSAFGVENPESMTLNAGEVATLPTPVLENYVFVGWFYDELYQNPVLTYEAGSTDETLYGLFVMGSLDLPIAVITYHEEDDYFINAFEGSVYYAFMNGTNAAFYLATELSDEAIMEAIGIAIDNGAEIVILPGFLYGTAAYEAQYAYPEVNFVLIDDVPHNATWSDWTIENNTMPILFAEQEAGFLAGYAAVMDGYRHLGFMGGMAVPAVVRYGIGFIAGAYYAAEELNVDITLDENTYTYLGTFAPSNETVAMASSWYQSGTEIIFTVAGGANDSVILAAEQDNGMVIGVDVDMSSMSDTILTSALKHIDNATIYAITQHFTNSFTGGEPFIMDVTNNGVGLSMDTSRFDTFSQTQYDAIYAKIVDGTIEVPVDVYTLNMLLNTLSAANGVQFEESTIIN